VSEQRKIAILARIGMGWCAVTVLVALALAPMAVLAQTPMDALGVATRAAEAAQGKSVTELALTVAIVSMLLNACFVAAALKLAMAWSRKPCMLTSEEGKAVVQATVWNAVQDRFAHGSDKERK
jgi:hypothetical protein